MSQGDQIKFKKIAICKIACFEQKILLQNICVLLIIELMIIKNQGHKFLA